MRGRAATTLLVASFLAVGAAGTTASQDCGMADGTNARELLLYPHTERAPGNVSAEWHVDASPVIAPPRLVPAEELYVDNFPGSIYFAVPRDTQQGPRSQLTAWWEADLDEPVRILCADAVILVFDADGESPLEQIEARLWLDSAERSAPVSTARPELDPERDYLISEFATVDFGRVDELVTSEIVFQLVATEERTEIHYSYTSTPLRLIVQDA